MKLYTEKLVRGDFSNVSFYAGIEAFYSMGFEIIEVDNLENLEIDEDNVFFGSINFIQNALRKLNIEVPKHNDYAKLIAAHWAEMTNQKDLCDF